MKIRLIIITLVVSFMFCSCSDNKNNTQPVNNSTTSIINKFSYEDFLGKVNSFNKNYKPKGYINISPEGELRKHFVTFSKNYKFEKRKNDAVDGDMKKPSKYDIYFIKNDKSKSILVKLRFIYAKSNISGVISDSVISPDDNVFIDDKYKSIERPFLVSKIIGTKDFIINMDTMFIKDFKDKNKSDKILELIRESDNLYMQLENLLIAK